MKKSTIWLLGAVMLFAFLGLLFMQANYINIILSNQGQQFEEAVKRSLYQVSRDLELEEVSNLLNQQISIHDKKAPLRLNDPRSLPKGGKGDKTPIRPTTTDSINIFIGHSFGKGELQPSPTSSSHSIFIERFLYNQLLLDEVLRGLMHSEDKPIEQKIDFAKLNNYIKTELLNNNLELPYSFAVRDNDKRIIYSSPEFNDKKAKIYSQILFPKNSKNKLYTLQVVFPTQKTYLLNSVSFMIPSIIFTAVLLIVFIFTLYIIFRQKRLSEMKNDFINNMTHELKTPVASISLAAQTLNDAAVNNSPQLMEHAKNVISEESTRLGFLVEKVLQMSLFEDGSTQFKLIEMDANDLIASIANTFDLRVEKTGGSLDVDLNALDSTILVDKMHFTNVLFNLMENAVKYRKPDVPLKLIARTKNVGDDKIQITIEDNGLGIKKENVKKVFDRFYRVPTGNRHDVKGFGLGLAYVKRIVTELNGIIKAESEYGEGTKFIITLPIIK